MADDDEDDYVMQQYTRKPWCHTQRLMEQRSYTHNNTGQTMTTTDDDVNDDTTDDGGQDDYQRWRTTMTDG